MVAAVALVWSCAACSRSVAASEVEGVWRRASDSSIEEYAATRFEFRGDGTFSFERMPGDYFGGPPEFAASVSVEGTWHVDASDGDIVRLRALRIDGVVINFGFDMGARGAVGSVTLRFLLSDPDGLWVYFEKAQFVRSESSDATFERAARG